MALEGRIDRRPHAGAAGGDEEDATKPGRWEAGGRMLRQLLSRTVCVCVRAAHGE